MLVATRGRAFSNIILKEFFTYRTGLSHFFPQSPFCSKTHSHLSLTHARVNVHSWCGWYAVLFSFRLSSGAGGPVILEIQTSSKIREDREIYAMILPKKA